MQLSVSTLKGCLLNATEIGRAVNGMRKHRSLQIHHLVCTRIEGWKVQVDEWGSTTNAALAALRAVQILLLCMMMMKGHSLLPRLLLFNSLRYQGRRTGSFSDGKDLPILEMK